MQLTRFAHVSKLNQKLFLPTVPSCQMPNDSTKTRVFTQKCKLSTLNLPFSICLEAKKKFLYNFLKLSEKSAFLWKSLKNIQTPSAFPFNPGFQVNEVEVVLSAFSIL